MERRGTQREEIGMTDLTPEERAVKALESIAKSLDFIGECLAQEQVNKTEQPKSEPAKKPKFDVDDISPMQ